MKQIIYILFIAFIGISTTLSAQDKSEPKRRFLTNEWSFSVFNNAISLPFSGKAGIFHTPLHPGISVSRNHPWNRNETHQIFQNFSLGVFYQQYVQTGVQIYSTFNYRFQMRFGLAVDAYVGAGYLHAFRDLQQFELNESGQYEQKSNFGQPRLMIPLGLNLSFRTQSNLRPFIGYGLWFQTPFAKEYIPVLPNTSLHLGVTLPL